MSNFPHYRQLDAMDCGPTCLRMVAKHYGRNLSAQKLREAAEIGKDGVNLLGIAQAAEKLGFKTLAVKVTLTKLVKEASLPCIVHWGQNHFVELPPNPLCPYRNSVTTKDYGIGLKNTFRRLVIYYPDRHELKVRNSDGFYYLSLKIEL